MYNAMLETMLVQGLAPTLPDGLSAKKFKYSRNALYRREDSVIRDNAV